MDFQQQEFVDMLSIPGRGATLCDGLNRREILRAGGLSLFDLTLPELLRAAEQNHGKGIERRPPQARSVNLFNLFGINPHLTVHDRLGRPFPVARGGDPV